MLIPEEFQEEALTIIAMLASGHIEDDWEILASGFSKYIEHYDDISCDAGYAAVALLNKIEDAAALEVKFQESD